MTLIKNFLAALVAVPALAFAEAATTGSEFQH